MKGKLSPKDFFPDGKTPYPSQLDALEATGDFLNNPKQKLGVLIIPTAGGKSPIATAIANAWLADKSSSAEASAAVILCINKALQNQYRKEFVGGQISVVMGASEFGCINNRGASCSSEVARVSCGDRSVDEYGDSECPYQRHRLEAAALLNKRPAVFNPHSFQAFRKNPRLASSLPSGNGIMIVDEAHELPNQLRNFLSLSLSVKMIEHLMVPGDGGEGDEGGAPPFSFIESFFDTGVPDSPAPPTNSDGLPVGLLTQTQLVWLDGLAEAITERVEQLTSALSVNNLKKARKMCPHLPAGSADDLMGHVRYLSDQHEQIKKIQFLFNQSQWVVEFQAREESGAALSIKPVTIPRMFLDDFFAGFSKVILMSGTIFDTHLQQLGLGSKSDTRDDVMVFQSPSRISPKRRKVYIDIHNGRPVNYRNLEESFRHFASVICDKIVPKLPGEKGIIHVSSHAQAEMMRKLATAHVAGLTEPGEKPAIRFLSSGDKGWKKAFEEFVAAPRGEGHPNTFLIAARRYEGVNLKGDLARISIIAKAPYPYTQDTMIQALNARFPGYIEASTMTSFIQASNRTTRGPDDWSLIVALDTNLLQLLSRFGDACPAYFHDQAEVPDEPDHLDDWRVPGDWA